MFATKRRPERKHFRDPAPADEIPAGGLQVPISDRQQIESKIGYGRRPSEFLMADFACGMPIIMGQAQQFAGPALQPSTPQVAKTIGQKVNPEDPAFVNYFDYWDAISRKPTDDTVGVLTRTQAATADIYNRQVTKALPFYVKQNFYPQVVKGGITQGQAIVQVLD